MKKQHLITTIFVLLTCCSCAQPDHARILREFATTGNDSAFVSTHSKKEFTRFVAKRYALPHVFDPVDSVMFYHTRKGDILGPYTTDSFLFYVKTISVDSLLRMRVGNIYLSPDKRGAAEVDKLAAELLRSIQKNNNYDAVCKQYADDNNKNKNCDLGWFFQGAMVIAFEKEVLKHKKGDCFIVTTEFGKHIVKVLDDAVKDRSKVEYTFLYLDKP